MHPTRRAFQPRTPQQYAVRAPEEQDPRFHEVRGGSNTFSATDRKLDIQHTKVKALRGVDRVFKEKASGIKHGRPV